MSETISEVLITEEALQAKVKELGALISRDYAGKTPLLIGVLKGAATFMVDLMRAIDQPVTIDFMAVSSYGAATESSGVVRISERPGQVHRGSRRACWWRTSSTAV